LEEESMASQVVLDDGGFDFTNLPTGAYAVAAIKEGAPPVLRSGVQVERGQRTDVLITMPLGASFTALVETRGQGGPVQGALVEVEPTLMGRGNPLEDLASLQAFTEANGRAPFNGLSSGTHRVHIRTPWGDELTENVEISPQTGNHEQRFLFSPAARLSGRVVDPQGQGVAGSEVRCIQSPEWSGRGWSRYPSREGGEAGATITDAAGNFEFESVPSRSSFTVTAISSRSGSGGEATSGGFAISDTIRLQTGEARAGLILRLGEGFELSGVVRDSDDLPLSGVTVLAAAIWSDQELDRRLTITGPEGEFVIHGLPAGRCRLTAELEGYSAGTLDKKVEQDLEGLELRVHPAYSLEGVVLDPDGWGIGGARVRARKSDSRRSRSRYATSDEYGRFALENLSPGPWGLGASAPGFPARDESKVTVEVPSAYRAELRLAPEVEAAPCVLAGEIVMRGSGKPVKGLRFHGYRYQTISLDGTRFEITGPPAKKLTLSVTGSNAESLTFPMVHLAPGDRVDLGRAETRHTVGVKVQVKDGSGRALSGADVWLQRVAGQKSLEYVAVPKSLRLRARGIKGEYSTSQVGMYEWRLVVRHSAWNSHASTVRVSADSTSFNVRLKEPRRRGGDGQ
jgi:protocatechuate 3,4-dioxygenase beta subunit